MLRVLRFCSCTKVDKNSLNDETRCMVFSFTPRALKILSKDFLETITGEQGKEVGIEIDENKSAKIIHIKKIDTNLYRIPTKYVDPFIKLLFKYLPGHFHSPDERIEGKCDS